MSTQTFVAPTELGAQSIRIVDRDGEPWFVAKDVCEALGLRGEGGVHMHLQSLDDDEKGDAKVATPGGNQRMSVVSEPGLYTLIGRSNKPEAKAFRRWVNHEVLPSIRKHGGYISGQEQMTGEELMAKALVFAQSRITALEEQTKVLNFGGAPDTVRAFCGKNKLPLTNSQRIRLGQACAAHVAVSGQEMQSKVVSVHTPYGCQASTIRLYPSETIQHCVKALGYTH